MRSFIGPAAAEGFFHEFSGWIIFIAAFETLWQRSASHAPDPIKPVAAKDD